ncbi:unnamed protein product [Lampetra planeri]
MRPRSRIPSPPPPPPDPLAARKAVSGAPTPRGFIPSPQAETPGGGAPGPAPSKRRDWKQLRGPAEEERRRLSSRAATQSPDAAAAAAASLTLASETPILVSLSSLAATQQHRRLDTWDLQRSSDIATERERETQPQRETQPRASRDRGLSISHRFVSSSATRRGRPQRPGLFVET